MKIHCSETATPEEDLGEIVLEDPPSRTALWRRVTAGSTKGNMRLWRPRLVADILEDLEEDPIIGPMLKETEGIGPAIETRLPYDSWREHLRFPEKHRWIACYAVEGNSEGHYVHVSAIVSGTKEYNWIYQPVLRVKTFGGMDAACALVKDLTKWFQAW